MRTARSVLTALALSAAPALAQTAALDTCRGTLEAAKPFAGAIDAPIRKPVITRLEDGWCVVSNLDLEAQRDYSPGLVADRIAWRGEGLDAASQGAAMPLNLALQIQGFRIVARTPDAATNYLMRAQAFAGREGIDADISLRRDPEAKTLLIEHISIDFPGENTLSVSARIEQVDLSTQASTQMSVGSAAITEVAFEMQSNGFFETYLLPVLTYRLLADAEDPEARAEELKLEAAAWIASLPDDFMSGASRGAVAAFIEDLPNPTGMLSIEFSAPSGFRPARFVMFEQVPEDGLGDTILRVFDGAAFTVTYRPR